MKFYHKIILLLLFLGQTCFSQEQTNRSTHFNGNISVTNNGFSFIPTFSLGEPATVFEFSVGGDRFSFDPQFRFENSGFKPWSLIFIWRYQFIKQERFQAKLGLHLPALSFRHKDFNINGVIEDRLMVQRFLTPELTLNYKVSNKLSVGVYSIYGRGLEEQDQTKNTYFFSLRAGVNQIEISQKLRAGFNPQIYYLTMDGTDGVYAAANISLAHSEFPLSIGSTFNQAIDTNLNTKESDWNISLIYRFRTNIRREK